MRPRNLVERALVGLLAVLSLIVATSEPALAASEFAIDVTIEGSSAVLRLNDVNKPVGALGITISGVGELAGECELLDALGSCAKTESGEVRVGLINMAGWDSPVDLVRIPLQQVPDVADITVSIDAASDVRGDLVEGTVGLVAESGTPGWVWPTVIVGALVAATALIFTRRR